MITLYMIDNIGKQKINHGLSLAFTSWISQSKQSIQLPSVDISDLRKIINLLYTGCCEYLGPVKTDEILNNAVQDIKNFDANCHKLLIQQLL